MTTSIDTNVLVALWDRDQQVNTAAQEALDLAQQRGALSICGAVYAELLALPGRTERMLDEFFHSTAIRIEWESSEQVWRAAGQAFQGYAVRRNRKKGEMPRRILADFVIGAHASVHRYSLLTLDRHLYRAAFPKLDILTF